MILTRIFFSPDFTANDDPGEFDNLGDFAFAALPSVGDRFTVWLNKKITILEVISVSQAPVPVHLNIENVPDWQSDHGAPTVCVRAKII